MKRVTLLYNEKAGYENVTGNQISSWLSEEGYETIPCSVKDENWKEKLKQPVDLILVSGGDGTVGKVACKMLDKHSPMTLLPFGTANNIAFSLGVKGEAKDLIHSIGQWPHKQLDIGLVEGNLGRKKFLESIGVGLFAYRLSSTYLNQKDKDAPIDNRDEKLRFDLKLLAKALKGIKPSFCNIKADGKDYSGTYLMVEVMNIKAIGPNLALSPYADPGDGKFELVLMEEKDRSHFLDYLNKRIKGEDAELRLSRISARKIELFAQDQPFHVDDKLFKFDRDPVWVTLQEQALDFLVPPN